MICVIAEKPSVAKEYAKVMGGTLQKHDGYLEGNGYTFTWAFGHLIELCMPADYGFQTYVADKLPLIPDPFKTQIKTIAKEVKIGGKKTFQKVPDPGVIKQLKIIENLFNNCSEIYVGTDAGREGELIFRYIYEYFNSRKPFKRIWISSQTDKAIKEGFLNVKPGSDYDLLFEAARSRSEADWLVGINASQALAIAAQARGVSLGRVQTPTLAMICSRYIENTSFLPVPYFQLRAQLEKGDKQFNVLGTKYYPTKQSAAERLKLIETESLALIADVEQKEKKEQPPLLYDLTALQQEANKKHGFSADETLKIAQTLYEKKLTTYPRTGSRYIGEDVFEQIPPLIENAKSLGIFPEKAFEGLKGTLNSRCVNAEKVTDHHALLPTETRFPTNSVDISANEKTVYQMIVTRMLEAFNEICIKDIQTVKAVIKDEEFKVFGTVIKKEGWRSVTGSFQDEEDKNPDVENSDILPLMVQGEKLKNMGIKLLEKETKPKPIHTEASLLKSMETCGKDIADEEMRDAMKDSGLGTPATRAAIIETLFTRDYIERKKKLLIPTAKGLSVYHLVKEKKIAAPEFTGEWERFLALIEKKQVTPAKFMEGIKKYSHLVVTEILNSSGQLEAKDFSGNENTISCPKCKTGQIRKGDKSYYCTDYKNGCDFKLWVEIAGEKLSDENIKSICEKGKTGNIKGFKGKTKSFDAVLKLKDDFSGLEFVFSQK